MGPAGGGRDDPAGGAGPCRPRQPAPGSPAEITADCRTVLGGSHRTSFPLAVKALEALEHGHHEAAQALAAAVTGDGGNACPRQLQVGPAEGRLRPGQGHPPAAAGSGSPRPHRALLHGLVPQLGSSGTRGTEQARHNPSGRSATIRGNAAVAILLTTSVLRALQELAEEVPGARAPSNTLLSMETCLPRLRGSSYSRAGRSASPGLSAPVRGEAREVGGPLVECAPGAGARAVLIEDVVAGGG